MSETGIRYAELSGALKQISVMYVLTFKPVPMAARSKAYVCGRSPAEILS